MPERRRIINSDTLEEGLAAEAKRLRKEAEKLKPGSEREALLRLARQAETGSHMSQWLSSPGLQPPRWCAAITSTPLMTTAHRKARALAVREQHLDLLAEPTRSAALLLDREPSTRETHAERLGKPQPYPRNAWWMNQAGTYPAVLRWRHALVRQAVTYSGDDGSHWRFSAG